jgi:peptidylprolyl isomerase domain and WD repeat-containing protein 1
MPFVNSQNSPVTVTSLFSMSKPQQDKRPIESDSEDEFGPMPVSENELALKSKKKAKILEFEQVYLRNLPCAQNYEHSYMHRDVVTHIVVSKATEFIITGSIDGHVKFWKKMAEDVEFVKHYQAHLGALCSLELSPDEQKLLTTSNDKMMKFFEIQSFDMCNMVSLTFAPGAAVWLTPGTNVAVADMGSPLIRIFSSEGSQAVLMELNFHTHPIR